MHPFFSFKGLGKKLIACIMLSFLFTSPQIKAQSQDSTSTTKVIRKIRFSGNKAVNGRTLETLIRTRTNRQFLGINRFTPWYFVWRVTKRFGERPSYLDRSTVIDDMERITTYYQNIGYFRTRVDTTIIEFRKNRMEVSFIIDEGPQSVIDTLFYKGVPIFSDPQKRVDFFNSSQLAKGRVNDSTYTVDQPYRIADLRQEQDRIINFLKDNGYASVQRDSVIANVDTSDVINYNVQFSINAGRVFRFGDVYVNLASSKSGALPTYEEKDTLSGPPFTTGGASIYLAKQKLAQSKFSLLHEQLEFTPGDIFNNSLYLRTVRKYQNLGMLFIRRFGLNEDSIQPDFSQESVPVFFDLQTRTKHSLRTEFSGLRRYGFGTGFGLDFTNNNVFGKAENLTFRANASLEFVTSSTLDGFIQDGTATVSQSSIFRSLELGVDYSLPRLIFPFRSLEDNSDFLSSRSRYSLSYSSSDQLFFDIRSDIRFNLSYEVDHSNRFSSSLDLIELDLVDTDPSTIFINNLREQFPDIMLPNGSTTPSLEFLRIQEDFRPQISSIIRYTFRSQRTNFIKRNFGYFSEYSLSIGGNVPYLIDRFITTPGTIEGNVNGIDTEITAPTDNGGRVRNALAYNRFLKFSADYRKYIPLSRTAVFAYRGFLGLAQPYGRDRTIPLNQRFFAGGSNDIRGWAPFRLGPGTLDPDEVIVNGGDIKLAMFTEARQIVFQNLFSANWHAAWYVDAGNVWYGPRNQLEGTTGDPLEQGRFELSEFYKEIAVGSGLGLRLDWEFIVVRFDFTFRAHDLNQGWFNNRQLYFSFGIGHSF